MSQILSRTKNIISNNQMGVCCDMFEKNQMNTNQSRLRLLQYKVKAQYSTQNDHNFTYYLHFFEQHAYLERLLREYREVYQKTEDSSAYQFNMKYLQMEIDSIGQYLKDMSLEQSPVYKKIRADQAKIKQQALTQKQLIPLQQYCMVKLQIQVFEIVQGITKLSIVKTIKKQNTQKSASETIIIGRTKNQKIYREIVFPTVKGSKIKIITQPTNSKVTIDVEDLLNNQAVCQVFKFQNKDQDFGFIALRLQFVSLSPSFNQIRKERLFMLQKQLKICALGPDGINRLSSRSNASSHVNTFVSDQVSEYPNQYHM